MSKFIQDNIQTYSLLNDYYQEKNLYLGILYHFEISLNLICWSLVKKIIGSTQHCIFTSITIKACLTTYLPIFFSEMYVIFNLRESPGKQIRVIMEAYNSKPVRYVASQFIPKAETETVQESIFFSEL